MIETLSPNTPTDLAVQIDMATFAFPWPEERRLFVPIRQLLVELPQRFSQLPLEFHMRLSLSAETCPEEVEVAFEFVDPEGNVISARPPHFRNTEPLLSNLGGYVDAVFEVDCEIVQAGVHTGRVIVNGSSIRETLLPVVHYLPYDDDVTQ